MVAAPLNDVTCGSLLPLLRHDMAALACGGKVDAGFVFIPLTFGQANRTCPIRQ